MTRFQRKRGYTNNSGGGGVLDLTDIKPSSSIYYDNNSTAAKIFCEFCDVPLIKKMDDIKLLGTQDAGSAANTRYICARCGNIKDPLKLADFDNLKRGERGQTIRSSSSSSSSDDSPFVEMFNNSITPSADDKDSLRLRKGTQLSRSLSKTDIIIEPNEEENMRSQNMRILRTETTYPESGRKVVKTFFDD
jgi:hypothetical protein